MRRSPVVGNLFSARRSLPSAMFTERALAKRCVPHPVNPVNPANPVTRISVFVNIFLRKIKETAKFTRKIDKKFKTGVILAHFDFFVKLFLKKKSQMIQLS